MHLDNPKVVALRSAIADYKISGSPLALDAFISEGEHGIPLKVQDIKTAWRGGSLRGWIYVDQHGNEYFQPDMDTSGRGGLTFGVDRGLAGAGLSLGGPDQPGPRPIKPGEFPKDWTILPGFDHHAKAEAAREGYPVDGRNPGNAPIGIGDQIPNNTKTGTTVIDINVAVETDGRVTGWLYLGADGERYSQAYFGNAQSIGNLKGAEVHVGPLGASGELPKYGPVQPWSGMGFTSGSRYLRGFDHGRCLMGDGSAENCVHDATAFESWPRASQSQRITLHVERDGATRDVHRPYTQEGRIVGVDGDRIIQEIRRGVTATYSRAEILQNTADMRCAKVEAALHEGSYLSLGITSRGFEVAQRCDGVLQSLTHRTQAGEERENALGR